MGLILTILIVIPALVMTAGILMRMIPRQLTEVRFQDTSPDHAAGIVLSYAEGTYENRLGYPTGFYVFDEKSSALPEKIVLKEAQPLGTVTDGCALGTSAMGAVGFEEGCGAGCVTMFIAAIIAAPFYLISALDRLYRAGLRSKVVVRLRSDGQDTVAKVALHGAGAFLMKDRYEKAFNPPRLPERFEPPAAAPGNDEAA